MAVHKTRRGLLGVVTLDRPEKAHAYNRALLDALWEAVADLAADVRVIVVESTGEGAFCSGADLKEMTGKGPLDALDLYSQRIFTRIARLPVVTIAAIQGPAVAGGFELALACDLRVAGPKARFWLPETALGILPSAGGTTRLARLVGPGRAKEVILGGRQVDAERALQWGLVGEVAADPKVAAVAWGEAVAKRDPVAMTLAKEILDSGESAASLAMERVAEAILYDRKVRT